MKYTDVTTNQLWSFVKSSTNSLLWSIIGNWVFLFSSFQRCFSPRGWERGQVVFVDLLALQYPDQNHCDVFVKRKNSTTPEQLPGEKCSILEEVSLLTNMRVCNNKVQVLPNIFFIKFIQHSTITVLWKFQNVLRM